MIELHQLANALALAKHKNFHRAAQAVLLSQSAFSRSIQLLEESVGIPLFDRGKRGVEPTPLGKQFLARAEQILRDAESLQQEMNLARGFEFGELRVGAGPYAADIWFGSALGRLLDEYPSLRVRLTIDGFPELPQLLRADKIELFVSELSEFEEVSDFTLTMFQERPGYFYCRTEHPLLKKRKPTLKDVVRFPLVCTTMPRRVVDVLQDATSKRPDRDRTQRMFPSVVCQHISLHKSIIANSNSVGLATFSMIENDVRSGVYRLLPIRFQELRTCHGIVIRKERTLSAAADLFIAILKRVDEEQMDWETRTIDEFLR